jgi:hypothetical protein
MALQIGGQLSHCGLCPVYLAIEARQTGCDEIVPTAPGVVGRHGQAGQAAPGTVAFPPTPPVLGGLLGVA